MNNPLTTQRSEEEALSQLGQRLADERLRRNQTQSDLAKAAGVSRATLQRLEAGHSTQVSNLIRVLRALDLPELDQVVPPAPMRAVDALHQGPHRRRRASSKTVEAEEVVSSWTSESSPAEEPPTDISLRIEHRRPG